MDILRLLPKNQYDAALAANAPTTANPFATIADITGGTLAQTLTAGDTMLAGQKIRTSNATAVNKFAIESIDGGVGVDVLSIYRDNGGSHDNSARIDLAVDGLNLTHRGTSNNRLRIDQANGFQFSSGNGKPVIIKLNSGFVMESGASLRYATFAITSLTAARTYTFQNATGTVAFLSDIPTPTGDGIYDGSGTTPSNTEVTITDGLFFKGNLTRFNERVEWGSGTAPSGSDGKISYSPGTQFNVNSESGRDLVLRALGANTVSLHTNNLERVTVLSDGKVGVNITSPSGMLVVKALSNSVDEVLVARNNTDTENLFHVLGNGEVNSDNGYSIGEILFLKSTYNGDDGNPLGNNVFIGKNTSSNAGGGGSEGVGNVGIGTQALQDLTTGIYNVGIGFNALKDVTAGRSNIAMGQGSLQLLSGSTSSDHGFNTSIGSTSGTNLVTGAYHTFVGSTAGTNITGGNRNTILGSLAGAVTSGSYSHSIAIGHLSKITASNQFVIGATSSGSFVRDFYFGRGVEQTSLDNTGVKFQVSSFIAGGVTPDLTSDYHWTFAGMQGTGTGVGGNIVFQVAPAGAVSNNVRNPLVTFLTLNADTERIESNKDIEVLNSTDGIILKDRLSGINSCRVYVQEDTPGNFTLYTEAV